MLFRKRYLSKVSPSAKKDCGGSFQVRLALTAAPDIVSTPTDIVLVLDRSESMTGDPLFNLKKGARAFIDIIDESTDGTQDGQIGGGSRIGIVSFASTATEDTGLITSVSDLKTAVNALTAGGSTNHGDAFEKASSLFENSSSNARVIVMFTDGETTAEPEPSPIAAAARNAGAVIYLIGLLGNGGIDVSALEDWASKPSSAYVAIAPNDEELEQIFEDLARNITNPGATGIIVNEHLNPCFSISALPDPTKGTAVQTSDSSLRWEIDELGVNASEGAVLEFPAHHTGTCSGVAQVNESITYSDNEGNQVSFPSPEIDVDCGRDVFPEPCPEPVELAVNGCEDTIEFDAGNVILESLGRIVQLDATFKSVCPEKRVALAVILTEVDSAGTEYKRGMKTMTIPAHTESTCRDVTVRCIKFVLPEDLNVSGESSGSMCGIRNLKARFIAHYIDNDFECCAENA